MIWSKNYFYSLFHIYILRNIYIVIFKAHYPDANRQYINALTYVL